MENSLKSVKLVFIEAFVVGICLIFLVEVIRRALYPMQSPVDAKLLFLSGVLFHVLFEYTGVNLWYSREYVKLAG